MKPLSLLLAAITLCAVWAHSFSAFAAAPDVGPGERCEWIGRFMADPYFDDGPPIFYEATFSSRASCQDWLDSLARGLPGGYVLTDASCSNTCAPSGEDD